MRNWVEKARFTEESVDYLAEDIYVATLKVQLTSAGIAFYPFDSWRNLPEGDKERWRKIAQEVLETQHQRVAYATFLQQLKDNQLDGSTFTPKNIQREEEP